MNFLVIGNGGREHAIIWKLSQSSVCLKIYVTDGGNPGINQIAEPLSINKNDFPSLVHFVKTHAIDYTVVGPEDPLANGIVDYFIQHSLKIFGPTQSAARLESSKIFAKEFMKRYDIPTAFSKAFDSYPEAHAYLSKIEYPCVVKADGLAAGKGVVICADRAIAEESIRKFMIEKKFMQASERLIIEEFLTGQEVSIQVATDGITNRMLVPSQDHKQLLDKDQGPNTGGMGAYAPVPFINPSLLDLIHQTIINPTLKGMAEEGYPYTGILYAGLMITSQGPKVIEFNCRMGDPETQVVLPLLKSDFAELIASVCDQHLASFRFENHSDQTALITILASGGYPETYQKGFRITGLDISLHPHIRIFQAGTQPDTDGNVVTSGGRVLGVTAMADTLPESFDLVYQTIRKIHFTNMVFRKDISKRVW